MKTKSYLFKTLLIALLSIVSLPSQSVDRDTSSKVVYEALAANLLENMISTTRSHASSVSISDPNKDLIHLCILDLMQELSSPVEDYLERNVLDLSKLQRTASSYAKFLANVAQEKALIQQARNLQDGLIKDKVAQYRKQKIWSPEGQETLEAWFRQSRTAVDGLSDAGSNLILSVMNKNFSACKSHVELRKFFTTLAPSNPDLFSPIKYRGVAMQSSGGGISFVIEKTSGN